MSRQVDQRTLALQATVSAAVLKNAEDPQQDIANERRRASFNVEDLLNFMNGGKEQVLRR